MRTFLASIALLGFAVAVAGSASPSLAAGGGGGSGEFGAGSPGIAQSPEKIAERAYRKGLKKRDNAWKHERKAAEATSDKLRSKELRKAAKDWKNAERYFREAIQSKPFHHQAYSSLGYALRKRGEWDK